MTFSDYVRINTQFLLEKGEPRDWKSQIKVSRFENGFSFLRYKPGRGQLRGSINTQRAQHLNQCRQTVNQSRSFIFDQIGSTYRIIPIFQYFWGNKTRAYRPAGSSDGAQSAWRNNVVEAEKKPKIRKQRYASRPRAVRCPVDSFINRIEAASIVGDLASGFSTRSTEAWKTRLSGWPAVHTTASYEPKEENAVGINARARSRQYETRRGVSQLKIVVEVSGKLRLTNTVGWFFIVASQCFCQRTVAIHLVLSMHHPMITNKSASSAWKRERAECTEGIVL